MLDVVTQKDEKIGLNTEVLIDLNDVAGLRGLESRSYSMTPKSYLNQLLLSILLVLRLSGCEDRSSGAVQVIKMADHLHHMANLSKKGVTKTLNVQEYIKKAIVNTQPKKTLRQNQKQIQSLTILLAPAVL